MMKRVKSFASWLVTNGALAWLLWHGYFRGNAFSANIFTFLFWLAVVVGTLGAITTLATERRLPGVENLGVPVWVDHLFDAAISISLASIGCFAMAGWWMWQAVCVALIHHKDYAPKEVSK